MIAPDKKPDPGGNGTILVASDSASDAVLVKGLLAQEFDQIFVSSNPDREVEDFENGIHDVLVLAFNTVEKAERYYLGLYRLSGKIHLQPHRTIILCKKEEVNRAYQLCRKEYFNDYVLFWPMTNDAPRLLMAVHHALRNLAAIANDSPSAAEFATQARHLDGFAETLDLQMIHGETRIEMTDLTLGIAEHKVGAAIDALTGKRAHGEFLDHVDATGLKDEANQSQLREIGTSISAVAEGVTAIRQWKEEFRKECAPHIESVKIFHAMTERIPSTILVIDDDDFQQKIIWKLLASADYRLVFASSGVEALNYLHKIQPDLILMDIMMPDLDGIETTKRIKALPQYANVPVIMITGNSEGTTVRDSLRAGAVNFVVKPFDRDTLLAKVAHALEAYKHSGNHS